MVLRRVIELVLVIAFAVIIVGLFFIRENMVEACERTNVIRNVVYDKLLDPAREARFRDGDYDTAADYLEGMLELDRVPHTPDADHPAEVDCRTAVGWLP